MVTIHGGIWREERRWLQELFRNNPAMGLLVATSDAGEGVHLQNANDGQPRLACYVRQPFTSEPDWAVTSLSLDIDPLLARATPPR